MNKVQNPAAKSLSRCADSVLTCAPGGGHTPPRQAAGRLAGQLYQKQPTCAWDPAQVQTDPCPH